MEMALDAPNGALELARLSPEPEEEAEQNRPQDRVDRGEYRLTHLDITSTVRMETIDNSSYTLALQ